MSSRIERDSLGTKRVPSSAYYGIQTFRAVENFPISGLHLQPEMVRAFALIKKAATKANAATGQLSPRLASAISRACDEVLRGKFDGYFVVDAFLGKRKWSF